MIVMRIEHRGETQENEYDENKTQRLKMMSMKHTGEKQGDDCNENLTQGGKTVE